MKEFCGCCGRETNLVNDYWCSDCDSHVIKRHAVAPHNRTYFAQFKKPCPYAEEQS